MWRLITSLPEEPGEEMEEELENRINKELMENIKNKYGGLLDKKILIDGDFTWIKYRRKEYETINEYHNNLDLSEYYDGERIKIAAWNEIANTIRNIKIKDGQLIMEQCVRCENIFAYNEKRNSIIIKKYYCEWDVRYNRGLKLKDGENNDWTVLPYNVCDIFQTECPNCKYRWPMRFKAKITRTFMEKVMGHFETISRGWP